MRVDIRSGRQPELSTNFFYQRQCCFISNACKGIGTGSIGFFVGGFEDVWDTEIFTDVEQLLLIGKKVL